MTSEDIPQRKYLTIVDITYWHWSRSFAHRRRPLLCPSFRLAAVDYGWSCFLRSHFTTTVEPSERKDRLVRAEAAIARTLLPVLFVRTSIVSPANMGSLSSLHRPVLNRCLLMSRTTSKLRPRGRGSIIFWGDSSLRVGR